MWDALAFVSRCPCAWRMLGSAGVSAWLGHDVVESSAGLVKVVVERGKHVEEKSTS